MFIDTHAHLNFNAFKNDFNKVIKNCLENNVWLINVGSQYLTSQKAVEIAQNYEKGVYASVGLHPIHLEKQKAEELEISLALKSETIYEFNYLEYKKLAQNSKVVAIGETGFDYYYKPKAKTKLEQFKNKQKNIFLEHLKLAEELNLPLIFHCRFAHYDLINILNTRHKKQNKALKGVVHCFSGTWEEAQQYLKMGFYLGFNGIIFKLNLDETIKNIPLDRILIETDCPYLTPPGFLEERNNPLAVKIVLKKIAEIKNIQIERLAEITFENARRLFQI